MPRDETPADVSRGWRATGAAVRRPGPELCDVEGIASRLGVAKWAVARVSGGRESSVIRALDERGVFAWCPVDVVFRRRSRTDRHKVAVRYPAAPGYVVAAIEPPFERWFAVMTCPGVIDLLHRGGSSVPLTLRPIEVERLAGIGAEASEVERHMTSGEEWSADVGDVLRVLRGPFAGFEARLLQPLELVGGGGVAVSLDLFGREVAATVALRDLAPI